MSDDKPPAPDIVQEALDCFEQWSAVEDPQRKREIEDLEFQVPEKQWDDQVRKDRAAQTINGMTLAERPMISIPKLDQPIQLVLNQEKSAHLGVQVHALNEDATDDTAEVLQGLYRAIEVDSRATLARSWAFERAVKAGRGFYRILTEYDECSDHPSDQKIVIKRIYEQGSAYLDPSHTEPDGSDAERAIIVEDIPIRRYKRLYKDSKLARYSDEEFVSLGNEREGWVTGDGEGRAVRVCEFFVVTYDKKTVTWDGGSREKDIRIVKWYKLNAVEVLEEATLNGKYIPLILVPGRELIPFDQEKRYVGIIGPNKGAQMGFNYAASASIEAAALEPKAPFDVDPQEIEGFEPFWYQANVRNWSFLPRHKFHPDNGQPFGPIGRIQADTSKMQINAMLLQQMGDFIHSGTAAFEPTLGEHSPNVKTKGATLALQQQSEQANSHWLDNLAQISMTHEARVILDMICGDPESNRAGIYDRPGRIARILDLEDNPQQVMFNAPFVAEPKQRPQALPYGTPQEQQQADRAVADPNHPAKHYDLTKGRYGVTVTVGKAYKSRVEQGKDELGQLFQAEPQLFSILGDIYLKFADFPGHREAAERMKKMLPPPLQDKEGQDDPKVQLDQAKAALQQMEQQLKELQPEKIKADVQIQTAQAKSQADQMIAQAKSAADVEIARMNNAAKVLVARITAAKEQSSESREDAEERLALGIQITHEAIQNEKDRQHEAAGRQHEAAMAAAGAGQQAAEADAGRQHDAQMGDRGHQQAMEQADQQGQIASAAAEQAAALQPSDNGAGA